jgi:hypothetical protein
VLRESRDADSLEHTCRAIDAIDAIVQTEMYLDANVTVAVALNQLAAALAGGYAEATT